MATPESNYTPILIVYNPKLMAREKYFPICSIHVRPLPQRAASNQLFVLSYMWCVLVCQSVYDHVFSVAVCALTVVCCSAGCVERLMRVSSDGTDITPY